MYLWFLGNAEHILFRNLHFQYTLNTLYMNKAVCRHIVCVYTHTEAPTSMEWWVPQREKKIQEWKKRVGKKGREWKWGRFLEVYFPKKVYSALTWPNGNILNQIPSKFIKVRIKGCMKEQRIKWQMCACVCLSTVCTVLFSGISITCI